MGKSFNDPYNKQKIEEQKSKKKVKHKKMEPYKRSNKSF